MAAAEPQIRANMLQGLASLLQSAQPPVDLGDILEAVGLPRDQQPEPNMGLPLNAFARLLELAAARADDQCFGLHFAHAFPRGGTRSLGFLILNAPDLGTCLECLCRFVGLQCEGVEFTLTDKAGIARLAMRVSPSLVTPRKQFVEFVMALIVRRIGWEFAGGCTPLSAEFEYREPNCGGEYELLFGRNLKFDAPETAVTMQADSLKLRSAHADERLFDFLSEIAAAELVRLDRSHDIVWQVGENIVANLALRRANLESAATALGLTSRQLQTELKRHGTTFDEEVARTRRALAERYLRDSDLALTEIALMLGFSELSAFTRATRSWLGMPPSQWRAQVRDQQQPKG